MFETFEPYSADGFEIRKPLVTSECGKYQWGFCRRDGKDYFIRKFLSPVFPSEAMSVNPKLTERSRQNCMEWFSKKQRIYETAAYFSSSSAIMLPIELFECRNHFYSVYEKLSDAIDIECFSMEAKLLHKLTAMKILALALKDLQKAGIVLGHMCPDDIFFVETLHGFYTAKLSGIDKAWFSEDPPTDLSCRGSELYCAPEIFEADFGSAVNITCRADVFSLGLIFHEILSGELPEYTSGRFACQAAAEGEKPVLNEKIPEVYRDMITIMLSRDPHERLSPGNIIEIIKETEKKRR